MAPAAFKTKLVSPKERLSFRQAAQMMSGVLWDEKAEQNCDYRLDGKPEDALGSANWLRIKQFSNGTLYLEASDQGLLNNLLEATGFTAPKLPVVGSASTAGSGATGSSAISGGLKSSGKTSETGQLSILTGGGSVSSSASKVPAKPRGLLDVKGTYIGTDESGKGDYFGPLVIAGVMVTDETVPQLIEAGVMDSKKLNDKTIGAVANKIRAIVGETAIAVIDISPKRYNTFYEDLKRQGKNLNHLLAWGHATAIESLLEQNPDCTQAIADQFGNERYILNQLKTKGKGITLYQTPKGEANIGVAAASILARERFVKKLSSLGPPYGVQLPPGASAKVNQVAIALVKAKGKEVLGDVAKLHFKTTQAVTGA